MAGQIFGLRAGHAVVELGYTEPAGPGTLWRCRQRRRQTVHVVASVAVVAKQQLVLIFEGHFFFFLIFQFLF